MYKPNDFLLTDMHHLIKTVKHIQKSVVMSIVVILVMTALLSLTQVTSATGKNNVDICVGNYNGVSFNNLVVPKGQTCQLDRFNVVNGDIEVENDAHLIVCPDNTIFGSIHADKPADVLITDLPISPCGLAKALGIYIGGDVDIRNGGSVQLFGNPSGVAIIDGNIGIKKMRTVEIQYFNTAGRITGTVDVKNSGTVVVADNTIGGDLTIKGTSDSCLEQSNVVAGKVNSCQ